jgi:hypothetical protein
MDVGELRFDGIQNAAGVRSIEYVTTVDVHHVAEKHRHVVCTRRG